MDNTTYYQRNRNIALNKAKEYYENNNERLKKQARDKYRNLSEEDKNKKREYGKNRYHNMSDEKKQKLKEYEKKYREARIKRPKTFYYLLPLIIFMYYFLTNYSSLSISDPVSSPDSLSFKFSLI